MKIYIETEMKEMPKGCKHCPYKYTVETTAVTHYRCDIKMIVMYNLDDSRPSWCPLREMDALPEIIREMAEAQTLEKTLKVHTDKLTAEFQLKLVSVEFKEEKE